MYWDMGNTGVMCEDPLRKGDVHVLESIRMSQRAEFVSLARVEGQEFKEACSRFGISRKTGYKWLKRFLAEGEAGLADRSRRPNGSPGKSSSKVEAMVLKLRGTHPCWGGRKLRQRLLTQGRSNVPSASTIHVDPWSSWSPVGVRRSGRAAWASTVWSGRHRTNFGRWISRVTLRWWVEAMSSSDGFGRSLALLDRPSRLRERTGFDWMAELEAMFRQYGLPVQMLMDNGSPWGDEGGQPWTIVTSWLVRLGIRVSHIRPRHPQTQGKEERFHRTLKAEVLRRPGGHLESGGSVPARL